MLVKARQSRTWPPHSETNPDFGNLPQRHIEDSIGVDRVVNDPAGPRRIGQVRDDPLPVVPPRQTHFGMGFIPFLTEQFKMGLGLDQLYTKFKQ